MPDIFIALLCLLYTFSNSCLYPHPLHSSRTFFSYWFPIWVQYSPFLSPCTNYCPSYSICILLNVEEKHACKIDRRYIPPSSCLYNPHMWSPLSGTLRGFLSPGRHDITFPCLTICGTPLRWEANRPDTCSWQSCLCPPSLGEIYLGEVQCPERNSFQRSHTTLPPCLHLLRYNFRYCRLLFTWFHIFLCPSPPLCLNTCIHQNPPPRYGTVLHRPVPVHPVRFIPYKDMFDCFSLYVEILLFF